ncbi:MAG: metallophosphoesterase [Crocinitomicaceae bacterium]|nr:metallophosphoesterase [Crocinitomicaceae bacterium]
MNRTLVIGDIHGGLIGLIQVLERAKLQPSDHLIFLGDYVDGWSESAEVIQYLIQLEKNYSCEFILGNHDAWCLEWLKTGEGNLIWLKHGGQSSVESYENISSEDRKLHIEFFERMKNYLIDDANRLYIHAGFSSMHGPEKEHYSSNYSWDRTLWELALAIHGKVQKDESCYPKRLKLFREIYIGHTPTLHWGVEEPWNRVNVWNLDTGAAFTGKLSVIDIDTKEFWQSETLVSLYPTEKGRN